MNEVKSPPEDLIYYYSGREDCHSGKSWASVRDHYLFHYILSGQGQVRIHGRDTALKAGQGFLFRPHELSSYRADAAHPWAYVWFAYHGKLAETYTQRWGIPGTEHIYESLNADACARALQESLSAFSRCHNEFDALAHLYEVFSILQEYHLPGAGDAGPTVKADQFMARVYEFIQRNFARESTSVDGLAEYLGLSRTHLSWSVKEHCGKSPRDLLMDYRMERAKNLLANSSLSIAEISASIGYGDQLTFSRAFHRHSGMAPRDFRNQSRLQ